MPDTDKPKPPLFLVDVSQRPMVAELVPEPKPEPTSPVLGMALCAFAGAFMGGLIVWLATRNWGIIL